MAILTGATRNGGIIAEPNRSKLYTRVKHLLGAPLRSVELEDEMLDSLLALSIGDYSQYIQDWSSWDVRLLLVSFQDIMHTRLKQTISIFGWFDVYAVR